MGNTSELQDPRIEEALNELLNSASFASSKQSQALLKYLVARSQHGDDGSLKERMIGVNVFGRPHDYNTGDDPIVRSRVGELRKRLASHYQHDPVDAGAVHFEIPTGSYRVTFHYQDAPKEGVEEKAFHPPLAASWNRRIAWLATFVAVAALVTGAWHYGNAHRRPSDLEAFWSPVVGSSQTVLIYLGQNRAYMPTALYMKHIRESRPPDDDEKRGTEVWLEDLKPGETLGAADVYVENNDLVSAGNIAASIHVATLLASLHRDVDVRTGNGLLAVDLEHASAVFLGAFDNPWTMQVSQLLPFQFKVIGGSTDALVEQAGDKRVWVTKIVGPNGAANEEYAMVARLTSSVLRKPVIVAAGLRSAGTRAAGSFITDAADLTACLDSLPPDWRQKNLEVVLKVEMVKGGPGRVHPIAYKIW